MIEAPVAGTPPIERLKLKYYSLLVSYHQHKGDYLEVCRCLRAAYDTPAVFSPKKRNEAAATMTDEEAAVAASLMDIEGAGEAAAPAAAAASASASAAPSSVSEADAALAESLLKQACWYAVLAPATSSDQRTLLEATAAEAEGDPADRLFAEDTARGLQLLRLLSRRFDVVAMNPPYGDFVPRVKEFVRAAYPRTYSDIYAAFIDRATQLVEPEGYVAALVSRTFVTHTSHERLRTEILLKRNPIVVLLDLGEGILEATVHTAALVLRGTAL